MSCHPSSTTGITVLLDHLDIFHELDVPQLNPDCKAAARIFLHVDKGSFTEIHSLHKLKLWFPHVSTNSRAQYPSLCSHTLAAQPRHPRRCGDKHRLLPKVAQARKVGKKEGGRKETCIDFTILERGPSHLLTVLIFFVNWNVPTTASMLLCVGSQHPKWKKVDFGFMPFDNLLQLKWSKKSEATVRTSITNLQSFIRWMEQALAQKGGEMHAAETVRPQAACRKEVKSSMVAQYTRTHLWFCNTLTLAILASASTFYVQCQVVHAASIKNRSSR